VRVETATKSDDETKPAGRAEAGFVVRIVDPVVVSPVAPDAVAIAIQSVAVIAHHSHGTRHVRGPVPSAPRAVDVVVDRDAWIVVRITAFAQGRVVASARTVIVHGEPNVVTGNRRILRSHRKAVVHRPHGVVPRNQVNRVFPGG
jgi:hypothetical protein